MATVAILTAGVLGGCATSAAHHGPGGAGAEGASPAPGGGAAVAPAATDGPAVELASSAAPDERTDPAAEAAVASAEQSFALDLLGREANGANVAVSPLGLAEALAMLAQGAAGTTLAQISSTLGTSALDPAATGAGWASLLASLNRQARAGGVDLESADALWLQKGLTMDPAFMADLARYFRSGVWQVDFDRDLPAALSAINSWTAAHTHGRIGLLFGPSDLDRTTRLALADALYFHAVWQDPFDPAESRPGTFYPPAGPPIQATFMQESVASAGTGAGYQAVRLAYSGGQFEALAVMPTAQSLAAFVAGLDPARLASIAASADKPAQLRLPRFVIDDYLPLDAVLAAMGMPAAFGPGADFSAMSPVHLQVQSVVQRDYLSVGEAGTEAAAATGIGMQTAAEPVARGPRLSFDHPFVFLVRDAAGTIVFASLVDDPSS